MVFAGRVYELLASITIYTNCGFGTGTDGRTDVLMKNLLFPSSFPG